MGGRREARGEVSWQLTSRLRWREVSPSIINLSGSGSSIPPALLATRALAVRAETAWRTRQQATDCLSGDAIATARAEERSANHTSSEQTSRREALSSATDQFDTLAADLAAARRLRECPYHGRQMNLPRSMPSSQRRSARPRWSGQMAACMSEGRRHQRPLRRSGTLQ